MKTTQKDTLIKDVILNRKSPLAFSYKSVSEEDLHELFDAARWAASAYNEQPWRFIYANKETSPEVYDKLFSLLVPANQAWAKEAPVLISVISKNNFSQSGKDNFHALYDTGLAVGNLSVQATAMGISLHQMGGFDREAACKEFNLGLEFQPVAMIALGYAGNSDNLPDDLRQRAIKPRVRKSVNEIAYKGKFLN